MVKTSEQSLLSSVCVALGEICRNGALTLPNGDDDKGETPTKFSVVKNLINVLESSKETAKVKNYFSFVLGEKQPSVIAWLRCSWCGVCFVIYGILFGDVHHLLNFSLPLSLIICVLHSFLTFTLKGWIHFYFSILISPF